MKEKAPDTKCVVKGSFIPFNRTVFFTFFLIVVTLIFAYQLLFTEITSQRKFQEMLLTELGFASMAGFMYWLTASQYYFYEFTGDALIVKNIFKKYRKEFYYDRIVKINLYGDLASSIITGNSIQIVYSESKDKTYKYLSYNFTEADWIKLIVEFQKTGLKIGDPNKEFFKHSEFKPEGHIKELNQKVSLTKKRIAFIVCIFLFLILYIGFQIPEHFSNPVEGAGKESYNSESFWFYPWGTSGTHKGVDIFSPEGTIVRSSTGGLVIFKGEIEKGGNVILILGPKWRLHYYAHLKGIDTDIFSWTNQKEKIGTVGTSGNAQGKPPHLHYAILTVIPYPWRIDNSVQGWKKMFYLNPIEYLESTE